MDKRRTMWSEQPKTDHQCTQLYTIGRLTAAYESLDEKIEDIARMVRQANELHVQNASRLAVLEAAVKNGQSRKSSRTMTVLTDVNTWISIGPWLLGIAYIILAKISSLPTPW